MDAGKNWSGVVVIALAALAGCATKDNGAKIEHLGNPSSAIASMVYVPAGTDVLYVSGIEASPANPNAPKGSPEYFGDTETQLNNILTKMKAALAAKNMGMGDVAMLRIYCGPDPALGNKCDTAGMARSFTKFFGTPDQPNKPARSMFMAGDLAHQPGQLLEVDAEAVRRPQ